MKTLSIIVPTYNVEDYIGKCLSSLVVDREDLEVLVIIDGSKDKSCEIAKRFQEKYSSIFRVIEKENGHYGSCVNVGLSLASGRYVKVLDADDSFDAGIADYLAFLSRIDVDLVLTDYIIVDEIDNVIETKTFCFEKESILELSSIVNSGISMMRHYEITYRTDLLRKIKYRQTEGIPYTDIEWSFLPFRSISKFSYYPGILYRYLKGRTGQTVDIEYRKVNMWKENEVVLGLAQKYEGLKGELDEENSVLLKRFLSSLVVQIYFHYLINFPKVLEEKELKGFDENLKKISEEIYNSVEPTKDERKSGTFYYIRDFRKYGTRKVLKFRYFDFCVKTMELIKQLGRR